MPGNRGGMPKNRPTKEDMLRAEREVGENLPETIEGVEGSDVGKVQRDGKEREPLTETVQVDEGDVEL